MAVRSRFAAIAGAFFTPYTMLMFILGLWLGYRGAVDQYRICRAARTEPAAFRSCPRWAIDG
jgi:hypothetical protein